MFILDVHNGSIVEILRTAAPTGLGDLSWSPDGTWIAFADGFDLALARPDGSGRIGGPRYYNGAQGISWSPDSASFLFHAFPSIDDGGAKFTPALFVSDLNLTAHIIAAEGTRGAWSSAADRVVFIRSESVSYLDVIDRDGAHRRTIATYADRDSITFMPFWRPDDSFVAYTGGDGIHLANPQTGEDIPPFALRSRLPWMVGVMNDVIPNS